MVLGGIELSTGEAQRVVRLWVRYVRRASVRGIQWRTQFRRRGAVTAVALAIFVMSAALGKADFWRGVLNRAIRQVRRTRHALYEGAGALRHLPLLRRMRRSVEARMRHARSLLRASLPVWVPLDQPDDPITAEGCIEQVEWLRMDLELAAMRVRKFRPPRRALRRALRTLVHQIDADLKRHRAIPNARLFQARWALRMLSHAVVRRGADPRQLLDLWLQGAYQTLGNKGPGSVGPTNEEFVRLMQLNHAA